MVSIICHTDETDKHTSHPLLWQHMENNISKWGGCRNEYWKS